MLQARTNLHTSVREGWRTPAAYCLLLFCSLVYVVRGFHDERITLKSRDFKTVYAAARCLLHDCDPYDSEQLLRVYIGAGGPQNDAAPFHPHESIYLPSGLILLTPFALFPWALADRLWLVASTGVFVLGAALIARMCLPVAPLASAGGIGLLLVTSTTLIMLGQPTQLAIGLCAIAVWCLLEDRYPRTAVVLFALSLALKPHIAGALWVYFALCAGPYRRRALQVLLGTGLLCATAVLWLTAMPASSHWMQELPANVAGITASGMPGDPGPRNPDVTSMVGLPTIFSLFRDEPAVYNGVARAVGAVLFVMWFVPVWRMRPSRERDWLALAAMACLSLLPVYHREYDTRILLLVFPAFSLLVKRAGWLCMVAIAATGATLLLVTHLFSNFVMARVVPHLGQLNVWATIFWLRSATLYTTLLTLFYVGCLWARIVQERRTTNNFVAAAVTVQ